MTNDIPDVDTPLMDFFLMTSSGKFKPFYRRGIVYSYITIRPADVEEEE